MEQSLYINGEWRKSQNDKFFQSFNPSNGQHIGDIADASKKETLEAIESASNAFIEWSKTTPYERSELLYNSWEYMLKNKEVLATIMTKEQGKTIKSSMAEVKYAADFLLWYAEEAKRINGKWIKSEKPNQRFLTFKVPVGVIGAITPWNYPISMITRKIAPALAAGCTIVLKPSELTPLCAIETFKTLEKSNFPDGVLNLITTSKPNDFGEIITSDPRVAKITFTGSTDVGRLLASKSGKNLKKISLELGGHAPFIVFPDADPIHAAKGLVALKFLNSGQACISPNRIFVHEDIKNIFIDTLHERVKKIVVADGFDDRSRMGPLINHKSILKVQNQIKDAINKGAKIIFGGDCLKNGDMRNGSFFSPTIISEVKSDMIIFREETFGPVIPIITYKDIETVYQMANDTNYGLAAYIYTKNFSKAIRNMENLNFSIIGINDVNPTSASIPFGGLKDSGIGREGGEEGIEEYLENKSVGIII